MRLTLRTLLAYLDNILDPSDAELLGNKIHQSEFATSLMHQIRGSVRRLRLDAPALDAQGIGNDLNSVAEYLDNVLPPEQVPALEKACLDNETNLGEVASCHQILTLVLGEAAPVTDKMRQHAYSIAPTAAGDSQAQVHDAHGPVPPPLSTIVMAPTSYPSDATFPENGLTEETTASPPTESPVPGSTTATINPYLRVDPPSTKETWRAEASTLSTESAESIDAPVEAPLIATAIPGESVPEGPTASVATASPRNEYPDYLPRKSNWLRSAFITGLIALLILAGMLFATGTIQHNFLTKWIIGESQQVASANSKQAADVPPTTPAQPDLPPRETAEPPRAEQEVHIVSPNQQQPESSAHDQGSFAAPNFDQPPLADTPPLVPMELDREDSLESADRLPDFMDSNGFRDPIETTNRVAGPTPTADQASATDQAPTPNLEPTMELLRSEPSPLPTSPADSIAAEPAEPDVPGIDNTVVDRLVEEEAPSGVVIVNREPVTPGENEVAILPPATILDADPLDLNQPSVSPEPVEPPVASSPDVNALATSRQLPTESRLSIVEAPEVNEPLEPTKLQRDDQLLLLFDAETESWVRLASNVQLQEGDQLLGLPAFRSDIEIGTGLLCSVFGEGRLRLGPGKSLTLLDGHVLLESREPNQTQSVRFGGREFEIQMLDPAAQVAIEATHAYIPGSDISATAPHALLKIISINHSLSVTVDGETYEVPDGWVLATIDDFAPLKPRRSKPPRWTDPEDFLKSTDRRAARDWRKQLGEVTDVQPWLEQITDRKIQQDQRSLAARSLAELDAFGPLVQSFNDASQHSYFERHFETLRRALTRGPEVQQRVRLALERAYGSEQAELMLEMLQGYSAKQLPQGAGTMLVKYLDHPNLELRAFAIENLADITGARSDYRPNDSLLSRSRAANIWRRRLKSRRGIAYDEMPEVVRLLEAAAKDAD